MGRSLSCRDPGTGRKVFEPKGKKEELAVAMVCVKSIEPSLWPLRVSVGVRSFCAQGSLMDCWRGLGHRHDSKIFPSLCTSSLLTSQLQSFQVTPLPGSPS